MAQLLKIIYLILAFIASSTLADRRGDAMRIVLQKLQDPKSYNKDVLPPTYNNPLDVYITLLIRHIDLDDKNMKMTTDLTFRMQWKDERLKYSVRDVEDITLVDYTKLWIPDPFFKHSQATQLQSTIHPEAFVRIQPDGTVLFSSRFVVVSNCRMDFHRYPHDRQVCEITLASYGYKMSDVKFSSNTSDISLTTEPTSPNRFEYQDHTSGPCHAETSTGKYSCIKAKFVLNREFKTYLLEWYIPCMFFVIVAFFCELVEADNLVPRLLLTLAPMLTLSATSLGYRSVVPSVPYPTALDIFTGISLMVIFGTLIHVIVSYYKAVKPKPEEGKAEAVEGDEEEIKKEKKKPSKFEKLRNFLNKKSELVTRVILMGFYAAFVFFYFAAYCSS